MNAIARTGREGAATVQDKLPIPPLPQRAADYLRALVAHRADKARFVAATPREREAMFVGPPPAMPGWTDAERAQLAEAAEWHARTPAPITAGRLAVWLAPVNVAVRNYQGQEDFTIKVAGLVALLSDLPAVAFTAEARRRLECDYFPSAADIRRAVETEAARLRAQAAAVASMLAPKPPAPARGEAAARREEEQRRHFSDPERVREAVERARRSPQVSKQLDALEAAVRRWAPHLIGLVRPELAPSESGS